MAFGSALFVRENVVCRRTQDRDVCKRAEKKSEQQLVLCQCMVQGVLSQSLGRLGPAMLMSHLDARISELLMLRWSIVRGEGGNFGWKSHKQSPRGCLGKLLCIAVPNAEHTYVHAITPVASHLLFCHTRAQFHSVHRPPTYDVAFGPHAAKPKPSRRPGPIHQRIDRIGRDPQSTIHT